MSLRIERLKIVAVTPERQYGAEISFTDGLNILRADNSSGKSTLANAILYGLGLEGMLGPDWPRPLKYALYEKLTDDEGVEHPVQESHVLLEISNGRGDAWTIKRQIYGELSTDLVQMWDGRALTDPGSERHRGDAFVRLPGSASREAGFHTQLTQFIGWDLPQVVTVEGGHRLLYLRCCSRCCSLNRVTAGSGCDGTCPASCGFAIRISGRCSFCWRWTRGIGLDVARRSKRQSAAYASAGRRPWRSFAARCVAKLLRCRGSPNARRPSGRPSPPALLVYIDQQRTPIHEALARLRARLRQLREKEIPTVAAAAKEVQQQLTTLEHKRQEMAAARSQLLRDVDADEADLRRIDERLGALEADRNRHQDARRVINLGGTPAAQLQEGRCPTCDQHWPHDLLGGDVQAVMTFEDNIAVIEQEQRALKALRVGAASALHDRRARLNALTDAWFELQADIRAHREVLVQDGRAPSAAAVRERLMIESRIERLDDLEAELDHVVERLAPLADEYRRLLDQREQLQGDDLSPADQAKVDAWERSLLDQLRAYGFRSIDKVRLSRETLLPEREGFDLTYEASASDTIRLIWSYLLGLMEVARDLDTNHPGLLIFDEPGQQDVENESVRALMERASAARAAGQQVIITITRQAETFISDRVDTEIVDFPAGQRVLRPLT